MATMSAETQAIIDRLKAEGDLIRNTGTNSLKSVRTEFAKFDGVFNSINANIAEQTSLMKAQLGIAEEAAEKVKTQEQLDELNNQRNTNSQQNQDARANEDRLGDKFIEGAERIGQQFTLKNMALLAAGGFVTYNLLKGFITQGIEDNLLGMGDLSKSFSNFAKTDFKAIGDTIADLGPTLSSMQESMSTLAASVASLNEAIETITSISWGDIAQTALTSIGALTAYNQTMKFINRRAANGPGMKGAGKKSLFRKLLAGGMTVATLGGIFGRESQADIDAAKAEMDDEARRAAQRNATDTIRAADKQAAEAAAAAAAKTAASSVSSVAPSVSTTSASLGPAPTADTAPDGYVRAKSGQLYRSDSPQGRMIQTAGGTKPITPTVDTTPFTRPVSGSGRGSGTAEVDQRKAGEELGKKIAAEKRGLIQQLAKSKIGKVVATSVPVLGLFAGLGFAGWNIIQGDFTSAALQLGSIPLPSVSGAALDISSIATEIFFVVSGREPYNQLNPAHRALMAEIGKEVHAAYIEFMEDKTATVKNAEGRRELYDNQEANDLAAAERAQMGGARAFSDSGYNPGIGNQSLGSNYYTGENVTLGSSSNFRGNYFVDKNGIVMFQDAQGNVMRAVDRPNFQNQLNNASGGANGTTIVHAPQNNVTAPVSVVDGGTQASINTVNSVGGGGGGPSPMPYGMTSGLVH